MSTKGRTEERSSECRKIGEGSEGGRMGADGRQGEVGRWGC